MPNQSRTWKRIGQPLSFVFFPWRVIKQRRLYAGLDSRVLEHAFSTDSDQYERVLWNSLKVLRVLAVVGVIVRFFLDRGEYVRSAWIGIAATSVLVFIVIELVAVFGDFDSSASWTHRRKCILWFVICETVAVTGLYVATRRAETDLYFLWSMPLILAVASLRAREVLLVVLGCLAGMAVAAFLADTVDPSPGMGGFLVLVKVIPIRGLFIALGASFAFYGLRYLGAQRVIWTALMEAMPEGLAIIGKDDYKIKWVNKVMKEGYFGDRHLIGEPCYRAYKRYSEPCDPCPTRTAFGGHADEEITRSPEYIAQNVDGSEEVPPPIEWRRYDTLSAPLRREGEIVGALECVKDCTCREVLHEATRELQGASTLQEVYRIIGSSIRSLGYRRCRIYRLERDGHTFAGVFSEGMDGIPFVGGQFESSSEPYSDETATSSLPRVCKPSEPDPYHEVLQKDPGMPWIDVPLRIGNEFYGKVSIDNKGHRSRARWALAKEFQSARGGRITDELTVLHNLSVQVSLAIRHVQVQLDMADLLASHVHSSIGLYWLTNKCAYVLRNREGHFGTADLDRAYQDVLSIGRFIKACGTTVLEWAEVLRDMRPVSKGRRAEIDAKEAVERVVRWCGFMAHTTGCKIRIHGSRCMARVDESVLEQIVFVLITNALRAVESNAAQSREAKVDITVCRPSAGRVKVSVLDNGPGVSEKIEPFLFSARAPGRAHAGLGLGLFVAGRLADIHGGRVKLVENVPGHRVMFSAVLKESVPEIE